ncbi:methionine ABC transporter ATP-binding protein [Candidatus Sororendozoicomonas aggregata]|uniref:methionine ABC transporter ATP-binding protein n=1 Tax=Candidatus Sororendozoicomonas aggregata TaxID=3073239 RepID=UPI002ED5FBB4
MIELKQVSKTFSSDGELVNALDNVSLTVPEGTVYGVIGASGAGKSTLIRCVNLLERPTSGAVIVDGQDLTRLCEQALRRTRHNMGMIFQHFNLLSSRTVFENIALPLVLAGQSKTAIEAAVAPLLELTGLADKRNRYPAQLSGGQKQRVAIARALASQPRVLLCDEATSALDPQTTRSILALLKAINRQLNITILMITHEMDVVKAICDRVAILDGGRLIEENSVEAFFVSPQTALAQEFVRSAIHEKPVADIEKHFQPQQTPGSRPVVRMTFVGDSANDPFLTRAARACDVDFVVLQADLETVAGKRLGFLMVEIMGDDAAIESALDYLSTQLKVEVLGYVS